MPSLELCEVIFPSKLYINLQVLCKIRPGDKLTTNGEFLYFETITPSYYLQAAKRFITGDGRFQTVACIENIIQTCFELVNTFLDRNWKSQENNQSDALTSWTDLTTIDETTGIVESALELFQNVVSGIENLKITYENDRCVEIRLNTLVSAMRCKGLGVEKKNNALKSIPRKRQINK